MSSTIDTEGGHATLDAHYEHAPLPTKTAGDRYQLDAPVWPVASLEERDETRALMVPVFRLSLSPLYSLAKDREDFLNEERSLTLRMKARLRRISGGDKDIANALYVEAEKLRKGKGEATEQTLSALTLNEVLADLREPLHKAVKEREKRIVAIAETLPAAEWVKDTRGFGLLGFGLIIAEAGDLNGYANPGKLWKRFGLAVFDGKAQGRRSGDEGIRQGFAPRRRALMWNIGDALVKQGRDYRIVYLERKEYEAERNPEATKMQHHKRAQRYMEKRLLRDLWNEWRRATNTGGGHPTFDFPAKDAPSLTEGAE